jgi:hypothetical protein
VPVGIDKRSLGARVTGAPLRRPLS